MFDVDYYARYKQKNLIGLGEEYKRAYFYKAVISLIRSFNLIPKVIIEIGCGAGYMSKHLANLPGRPHIISTDLFEVGLRIAKDALQCFSNVSLQRVDAQNIPFLDSTADIVIAFDVIEHLPEPERFISEAYRVMKPNGTLLISTPNPSSLGYRIKGHHPKEKGKPYEERMWEWHGYRDDTHINIRSINEWRGLLKKNGFIIARDGTDFWWDTPYIKHVPILLQKILFNGTHRVLTKVVGFLPWTWGENYLAVCRKPAI